MATFGEYLGAGSGITGGLWHLNGDATDSSGNGNDGTVVGAVTFPSGKFGLGASGGATTKRITIPRAASLEPINGTISLWFNMQDNAQQKCLFGVDSTLQTDRYGYLIWMSNTGVLKIEIANATTYVDTQVATGMEDSIWHNVVMTWDASNLTGYLDGVQTAQTASITIAYNNINIAMLNTVTNTARWMTGTLDEVIIENVVWTPAQVKKYYTYSKGRYGNL